MDYELCDLCGADIISVKPYTTSLGAFLCVKCLDEIQNGPEGSGLYRGFLVMTDDIITTRSRIRTMEIEQELNDLKVRFRAYHVVGNTDDIVIGQIGLLLQAKLNNDNR